MFDEITEINLLYDFYGALLTDKQRNVIELYREENLSLAEIAEEQGVSKQAVHDTLKKTERILRAYEEKLGLVKRFEEARLSVQDIDKKISALIEAGNSAAEELAEIKDTIDKLEF